jgi:hypothetical protein
VSEARACTQKAFSEARAFARKLSIHNLETDPQRDLSDSRRIGLQDLPKSRIGDGGVHSLQLCVVQYVEEIRAKFGGYSFSKERGDLAQSQVLVETIRPRN